jgi:hypothetical protein
MQILVLKYLFCVKLGMVVHIGDPSTEKAEAGRCFSSRPALVT